jgi:hypothetical protein
VYLHTEIKDKKVCKIYQIVWNYNIPWNPTIFATALEEFDIEKYWKPPTPTPPPPNDSRKQIIIF